MMTTDEAADDNSSNDSLESGRRSESSDLDDGDDDEQWIEEQTKSVFEWARRLDLCKEIGDVRSVGGMQPVDPTAIEAFAPLQTRQLRCSRRQWSSLKQGNGGPPNGGGSRSRPAPADINCGPAFRQPEQQHCPPQPCQGSGPQRRLHPSPIAVTACLAGPNCDKAAHPLSAVDAA